jgi:GT2 family glycosyltransferase
MTDIDIVVVNYKSASHTVKCAHAASRVAQQDGLSVQIYIVNNGDDDQDVKGRLSDIPEAQVIDPATNIGFGAACNAAAARGQAPYILFLNPDASVESGALKALTGFLALPGNGHYGIVGPEMRNAHGDVVPSCSRLPRLADLVLRTAGLHHLFRKRGYPYLSLADHAQSRPVGQVMGAALMIRRSVFDALNGFDERYFLYYEDVDLSLRAKRNGADSYYLKDARATHEGRVSSSQDSGLALALHIRSRLTFARRHFGRRGWLVIWFTCVVIECPVRMLQAVVGAGALPFVAVLRAYTLLIRNVVSSGVLPAARTKPAAL